jgi:hypothetical protein
MLQKKPEWSGNGTMNGSKSNLNGSQEETTDYLFSKNQLRQVVREILAEMLGVQTSTHQRKIYPTSKAWRELGYDCQQQLYEAVSCGLLRVGYEVEDRRKPQSQLPRYYFDIERCQKRLKELPEKRKT